MFRVGDRVRCIEEIRDVPAWNGQLGVEYIITQTHGPGARFITGVAADGGEGRISGCSSRRFELVELMEQVVLPQQEIHVSYLLVLRSERGLESAVYRTEEDAQSYIDWTARLFPGQYQVAAKKKITVRI